MKLILDSTHLLIAKIVEIISAITVYLQLKIVITINRVFKQ
jgi:hypothetical protein